MVFKKFFKKKDREFYREEAYKPTNKVEKDYIPFYETSTKEEVFSKSSDEKYSIKVFRLENQEQVREISDRIRDRKTICLIDIHILRERDEEELRRIIHRIKKTAQVVDGEVVGFSAEWILAAPENISIDKNKR